MVASEKVLRATLEVTKWGLVFLRNYSLSGDIDIRCVNGVAEALHELPVMVLDTQHFDGGESEMLALIRTHLSGFDFAKWPGSPNLLARFNDALQRTM